MYEKQMELFNDGGLKDEGGMIDEVSGNDVPVGSTREEVRDDIPAMLSEGEFVFPADVVRYLGLNRLMQLRQEAKMGLKQMEAMGQMGNSEEAIIPDDLPFDVLEIMVMEEDDDDDEPQEKYQGGVLHAKRGTFVTPMFDPSNQDVRKYVNADGKTLMIPFLNGNPVYPVPAGYLPEGAAAEETPVEEAVQSSDDNDPPPPPPQSEFEKLGGWNMDTSGADGKALDLWLKEAEKITTTGNVVVGILAAINPLIAAAAALTVKKQKKIIEGMLPEKLAQAKKTPIAGQVDTTKSITKRLTTKKGKGILSTLLGEILDPVVDALGFGEEEKEKAKTVASTVADQDPSESDAATEQAVNKSLRPQSRPDGLPTTAENFRETEANSFDDRSNYIVEADDLEATDGPTTPELPRVKELQSYLTKLDTGEFEDKTLFQPDKKSRFGFGENENRIDEPPNIAMPEEPTVSVPSLTELTLPSRSDVELEAGPATVTTAVDDLRKSISDLIANESRATAMSSLSGFGEGASSQATESYLEKAMNNVDTIVQSADTPPAAAPAAPAAPVQSGGDDDDDDGGVFSAFSAPTSNVGNLQGMSTADKTAAVALKTDNLSPTASTGGAELDTAMGISGLSRGGFAKRKKK